LITDSLPRYKKFCVIVVVVVVFVTRTNYQHGFLVDGCVCSLGYSPWDRYALARSTPFPICVALQCAA
jgi:hypothetical protein